MRIVNLIQCTNLGGMEQASLRLMRALVDRGHQCHVISLNPLGELTPLLEAAKISAEGFEYSGRGGWRNYFALKKRLLQLEADALIMTGHNLTAQLSLGKVCRGRRILAIHFHHTGTKQRWQWRTIYGLASRTFNAITYPSDYVRQEAESIFPPVRRIAHTVRNPLEVPDERTYPQSGTHRQKLGLPEDAQLVGNAGWLIPRKRFDVFLEAAKIVADQKPNAHFAIAGDGPERKSLELLADKLGISEKVHWLGWQRDLSDFYRSIDVLLFNSDWDALATTPLEAMSYGRPVVASVLNGGLKEIITDEQYGTLYKCHDRAKLAASTIRYLSRDPRMHRPYAQDRIRELCSPQR